MHGTLDQGTPFVGGSHMEARGQNIMTKEKLLAVGDKYETMIAADKAADAEYK